MTLNHYMRNWCFAMYVIMGIWKTWALPNIELDSTRIYLPHELDELRQAVAYERCKKDPNCDPKALFEIPEARCGTGTDNMLSNFVNVRFDVPGGCNPFTDEILWPATGECVTLLTQGPCPQGFWVKIRTSDSEPVCESRPCGANQALMENKCADKKLDTTCPQGQRLIDNEFGKGECECAPGTVYHALTQACYTPYSQGPCPPGQIIKVLDTLGVGRAECISNLCPEENMVMINDQCQVQHDLSKATGTCYSLETQGPCKYGFLAIDEVLLEPLCFLETETHSIFNLPNLRGCARGSIRDSQGRCRVNAANTFGRLPPIATVRPGTADGRLCPDGFLFLGGNCHRLALRRRGPRRGTRSTTTPTPVPSTSSTPPEN